MEARDEALGDPGRTASSADLGGSTNTQMRTLRTEVGKGSV